jgi:hypothetical protein
MKNMSNKRSLIQKTLVEFQRETEMPSGGLNTIYIADKCSKLRQSAGKLRELALILGPRLKSVTNDAKSSCNRWNNKGVVGPLGDRLENQRSARICKRTNQKSLPQHAIFLKQAQKNREHVLKTSSDPPMKKLATDS